MTTNFGVNKDQILIQGEIYGPSDLYRRKHQSHQSAYLELTPQKAKLTTSLKGK